MNPYPTTKMVTGEETAAKRERYLTRMLFARFDEWVCDYRIDLRDIRAALDEYEAAGCAAWRNNTPGASHE